MRAGFGILGFPLLLLSLLPGLAAPAEEPAQDPKRRQPQTTASEEEIPGLKMSDSPDLIQKEQEPLSTDLLEASDASEPQLVREEANTSFLEDLIEEGEKEPVLPAESTPGKAVSTFKDLVDQDLFVLTSGKQIMKLREVPESIFVLTREEIQNSGAYLLPQVLRLVPGMDVTQLSEGHYDVDLRDHEQQIPSGVLLLIDSKPVYFSSYNYTIWAGLPVVLSNIERIEVIKGPGSTLYGSHALKGIVNVITRKPGPRDLSFRLQTGPQFGSSLPTRWENLYASGRIADTWKNLGASVSATFLRDQPWEEGRYVQMDKPFSPRTHTAASTTVSWKPAPNIAMLFRGNTTYGEADEHLLQRSPGDMFTLCGELEYEHASLLLNSDSLNLKAHLRTYTLHSTLPINPALPLLAVT